MTPGSSVAIFIASPNPKDDGATRLLLPAVKVIAIGTTTVVPTTTTNPAGAQTTEALPKTLFTLAASQNDAEKIMYAATQGRAHVRPGERQGDQLKSGPGVNTNNLFR